MNFKENVLKIMNDKKISKEYIYTKLNISRQGFDALLNSKDPKVSTIIKLSKILECEPAELIK